MKKNYVAAIAIAAVIVVSLAATAAILQNQPSQSSVLSSGSTNSQSGVQSQSGAGQLVVMGTDPPHVSDGVDDAKAHYSSVQAHKQGSDMSSGWVQLSGSGTLDLMASGTAQTIATSTVNAGSYDAFRFNVDSVQVVYHGQAYAATVASTTVVAQSQSRVLVNGSSTTAAVVDMRTFVMNTGNSTKPQFIFSATAVATAVPPSSLLSVSLQVGSSAALSGTWWTNFVAQTSNQVNMAATVTSGSMALTFQNTGNANAEIQEVIVTPVSASASTTASLPASLTGSAVFMVSGSGSLQPTTSLQSAALLNAGATLTSGASTTLNYSGNMALNFGLGSVQITGVTAGQQYIVTVIGANTYASALVVAS